MSFSYPAPRLALVIALLAGAAFAGCNLFDPLQTESDRADVLVEDARDARAAGNLDRAVDLLERALTREPSNPVVRFELASTLTQRERLTILDLERVLSYIDESLDSGATAGRSDGESELMCTFGEDVATSPFDPAGLPEYPALAAAYPTLTRVIELMNDPDSPAEAPALPSAFTSLSPCGTISESGFQYDRAGVHAALLDQFGADEMVTGALSVTAIAHVLTAYVAIFNQPDLPVSWVVTDDDHLGACIDAAHYDTLVSRVQSKVLTLGRALIALDQLAYHTGNPDYQVTIDDALHYYEAFADTDFYPCG